MLRVGGESRAGSFYIRGVAVTSRVQRGAMRGWGLLCGIALSLLLQPPPCSECGDIGMGTGGAGGTSAFRCMSRGEDGIGMGWYLLLLPSSQLLVLCLGAEPIASCSLFPGAEAGSTEPQPAVLVSSWDVLRSPGGEQVGRVRCGWAGLSASFCTESCQVEG